MRLDYLEKCFARSVLHRLYPALPYPCARTRPRTLRKSVVLISLFVLLLGLVARTLCHSDYEWNDYDTFRESRSYCKEKIRPKDEFEMIPVNGKPGEPTAALGRTNEETGGGPKPLRPAMNLQPGRFPPDPPNGLTNLAYSRAKGDRFPYSRERVPDTVDNVNVGIPGAPPVPRYMLRTFFWDYDYGHDYYWNWEENFGDCCPPLPMSSPRVPTTKRRTTTRRTTSARRTTPSTVIATEATGAATEAPGATTEATGATTVTFESYTKAMPADAASATESGSKDDEWVPPCLSTPSCENCPVCPPVGSSTLSPTHLFCQDEWITRQGYITRDNLEVQALIVRDEGVTDCDGTASKKGKGRYLMCVGSILDEQLILTSASCLYEATLVRHNIKAEIAVVVGATTDDIQVIRVTEYKVHPMHETDPLSCDYPRHNVAILKLECRINEENLRKVCLSTKYVSDACYPDQCIVTIYEQDKEYCITMRELTAEGIPAVKYREPNQRHKRDPKLAKPPKFSFNVTRQHSGKLLPNVVRGYGFKENGHRNRSRIYHEKNTSRENGPERTNKNVSQSVTEKDFYNISEEDDYVEDQYVETEVNKTKLARDDDGAKEPRDNTLVMGNYDMESDETYDDDDEDETISKENNVTGKIVNHKELTDVNNKGRLTIARRSKFKEEASRRFGMRSYSFTVGANTRCPHLGTAVMNSREQVAIISKTCDLRQPATRWEYTRIIDNRGWILMMQKQWNIE